MATNIHNFNKIEKDIADHKIKLLGLGCFTYGVADYWLLVREMIQKIAKIKNEFDIFLEDPYPLTERLDKVIHGKLDLKLDGDYNYFEDHPLKDYVLNIGYDTTDFLQFLKLLQDLNGSGKKVNIYGVGTLLSKNDMNLIMDDDERVNKILEYYPELKNNDVISKLEFGLKDPEFYTYSMIMDYMLKNRNFSIFIGHVDLVQKLKLGRYETVGYKLNDMLHSDYVAVGTSGAEGEVTFVAELEPSFQQNRVKIYSSYKVYEKPKDTELKDAGTLQKYVRLRMKDAENTVYLKPMDDSDLSYYRSGEIMFNMEDKKNYNLLKNVDYHVFYNKVKPTRTITVHKNDKGEEIDPEMFTDYMA